MALEVELKLLLPCKNALEIFAQLRHHVGANWQAVGEKTLKNAYFDSHTGWFRSHDFGLRSREYNQQFEQTIKLAGQGQGAAHIRPEYNLPCAGMRPDLQAFPTEIWPSGTDVIALQADLVEMFRTDFHRQVFLIEQDSLKAELVFDQGSVVAGGQSEAIAEIELELISGSVDALFAQADALLQQAPLLLGVQSKAERGYRLVQQQPLVASEFSAQKPLAKQLHGYLINQILHTRQQLADAQLQTYWQLWQQQLQRQQHPLATSQREAKDASQRQRWLLQLSAFLLQASDS